MFCTIKKPTESIKQYVCVYVSSSFFSQIKTHKKCNKVEREMVQIVEKDPERSIVWFWKAINAGDRVDSALKDMAVVMKQQDRAAEAVEAIKSFRHLCSNQSQESIDNILIDLYKVLTH